MQCPKCKARIQKVYTGTIHPTGWYCSGCDLAQEDPEVQYKHHCLLTFMGLEWMIWRVRGHLIDCVQNWYPFQRDVFVTIDIADVDFDSYCTAAAAWDAARERA